MKHAGETALDAIDEILAEIRRHSGLTERSRGIFYRKSSAFLHFHEDPAGLFADLKVDGVWRRLPVNTRSERAALLDEIAAAL